MGEFEIPREDLDIPRLCSCGKRKVKFDFFSELEQPAAGSPLRALNDGLPCFSIRLLARSKQLPNSCCKRTDKCSAARAYIAASLHVYLLVTRLFS
jgi:hypothetical protein